MTKKKRPSERGGDRSAPVASRGFVAKKTRQEEDEENKQDMMVEAEEVEEDLEFEDEWSDEYEEEDIVNPEDAELEDGMHVDKEDEDEGEQEKKVEAFIPGRHKLAQGEVLEPDNSAYHMLHSLNVEWPCLSFDILPDNLGNDRKTFPMTAYVVAGTQADNAINNQLLIMKMSQLSRTKHDDSDDDSENEDDEEEEDDPILEYRSVKHHGGVNRIRLMPQTDVATVAATFADTAEVHLFDLSQQVKALDVAPMNKISQAAPTYTVTKHSTEGFALDWSRQVPGKLLSGDCNSKILLTSYQNGGWTTDNKPYEGHTDSVEDIQWSPYEKEVFASGSVDKTIRIWDARKKNKSVLNVQAHTTDVNVISWSKVVSYLLASGSDDGTFRIWDLRHFKSGVPVSQFTWHQEPITTIEWHPSDESVLAVGAADDQLTIWDFSVEKDDDQEVIDDVDVPPQLLFIHQGQTDLKELHWHPQIPGAIISTAFSGFNIFKTISV